MISFGMCYQKFANTVCRLLVRVMDVRFKRRVKRLSEDERQWVRSIIRPGDILVDSNDAFPGWQLASKLFLGSDWVHMAFYIGDENVIDAGKEELVAVISLERFLRTSRVAVLRPLYRSQADIDQAIEDADTFVGKPYNSALNLDSTQNVYCTQMLQRILGQLSFPITIPSKNVLGREIVSPDAFIYNDGIRVVWSSSKIRLSGAVPSETAYRAATPVSAPTDVQAL